MQSILALMIPIIALMIPITAILVHSPVGKAWARRLESGAAGDDEVLALKARLARLESQQIEQQAQVQQLQESTEFYKQLLESRPPAPELQEPR